MIRSLIRPSYRWVLLLCLALVPACGKKEPAKPAPALTQEQADGLRKQVEELRQQAMDLSSQITQLRRDHMDMMSELTTQTQRLAASLNSIDSQLGGKMVPLAIRPAPAGKGTAAEHNRGKGPISPFARFLLIVIILCAIWVLARLFLKHLSEDEEEEDDDLAPDEESPVEAEMPRDQQTPAPAPTPEVKNPLEGEPLSQNNEGAEHKG